MLEGDTQHFDQVVREWVHRYASPGMTRAMTAISLLGYNVLIVELVIALAVFAKVKVAARSSLVDGRHGGFARARPDAQIHLPSHAAHGIFWHGASLLQLPQRTRAVLFLFLWRSGGLLSARTKPLVWRLLIWFAAAALVIAIGLSRIYLGLHYPSDVVAGYLAATVWVGMIIVLDHLRKVRKNSKKKPA